MRAVLLSVIALCFLVACPATQSDRCKDLCRRMVLCIEALERSDLLMDESECTTTCTALERDSEGKKRVDEHAECVDSAESCEDLLACQ